MAARPAGLSETDLTSLATAAGEGRRRTVYLVDAVPSLGVEAGTSARVVSVSGTTVTLRPRGIGDDLSYEAHELRLHKSAPRAAVTRRRATAATRTTELRNVPALVTAPAAVTAKSSDPAKSSDTASSTSSPPAVPVRRARRGRPAAAQKAVTRPKAATAPARTSRGGQDATSPAEPELVTATLVGAPDGTWSVTVVRGTRRVAAPEAHEVTPAAARAAADALGHPELSTAVNELLAHAHSATALRVAELRTQLDRAETDLATFSTDS